MEQQDSASEDEGDCLEPGRAHLLNASLVLFSIEPYYPKWMAGGAIGLHDFSSRAGLPWMGGSCFQPCPTCIMLSWALSCLVRR